MRTEVAGNGAPWTCRSCTLLNKNNIDFCVVCETRRETSDDDADDPRTLEESNHETGHCWSCQRCSFSNIEVMPYCEICEAPRNLWRPQRPAINREYVGAHSSPLRTSGQAWIDSPSQPGLACTLCSYLNPPFRSVCEVCEAPLASGVSSCNNNGRSRDIPNHLEDEFPTPVPPPQRSRTDPPAGNVNPKGNRPTTSSTECVEQVAVENEERKLLLSMGWVPPEGENMGDETDGLEDWEIDAAQESCMRRLQADVDRLDLHDRARMDFEAWKLREQGS